MTVQIVRSFFFQKTASHMQKIQKTSSIQNLTHSEVTTGDSTDVAFGAEPASHGFTTLVAAAPVIEPVESSNTKLFQPPVHKDILSYLERPTKILAGVFGNNAVNVLATFELLPTFYRTYLNNLQGAYGFTATACFRVEIVAAPQTSGVVKMAYYPLVRISQSDKVTARCTMSQVQNVEINISEASAAEMKVPFLWDRDFMPVRTTPSLDTSSVGTVVFQPYLPVQWDTTTASTPNWTIFLWFEDIVPIGKTTQPNAVVPQMDMEFTGPVSKWFGLASSIASRLSSIPLISTYAKPVSWASKTAAMVAAHFGWSKPVNGSYTGIVGPTLARAINTCADQDMAHPLAMYANNEVQAMNFANSTVDEMSFCYLTCKPSLIATVDWVPTDTGVKWTCPVTPTAFYFQSGSGFAQKTGNYQGAAPSGDKLGFYPSTISFIGSNFRYWRGDLVFRFKFARTKFHTGRLLVGYMPYVDLDPAGGLGTLMFAPSPTARYDYESIVVDLRSTSEVDLDVPYTYPSLFCDTGFGNWQGGGTGYPFASTGVVFVQVIDKVYGPDNVPQNVPIAIEVFSKCGMEFSYPITSCYGVLAPGATVQAQMDMGSSADDMDACTMCAGERILSVKQLAMRPLWQYSSAYTTRADIPEAHLSYMSTVAFAPDTPYNEPKPTKSIISHLSSMYGLIRGSLIVRFVPALTSTSNKADFSSSVILVDDSVSDWRHNPYAVENGMVNMVKIPFYYSHNRVRTGWSGGGLDIHKRLRLNMGGVDSACNYGVAAGDDFQLGAFNGVPACVWYGYKFPGDFDAMFFNNLSAPT